MKRIATSLIAAALVLASAPLLLPATAHAESLRVKVHQEQHYNMPKRGMTMDQVATKFGAPTTNVPAVGKPPISRWEYPGFVVYFEAEHVIHSVVANSLASLKNSCLSILLSRGILVMIMLLA